MSAATGAANGGKANGGNVSDVTNGGNMSAATMTAIGIGATSVTVVNGIETSAAGADSRSNE